MKRLTRTILLTVIVIFLCTLCSCSILTFDKTEVKGGMPLNDELMQVIKGEIFSENSKADSTDKKSEHSENTDISNNESDNSNNENESSTAETVNDEYVESSLVTDKENTENLCYWTESGSVWHTYRDCHHIKKSSNVLSGSDEEARAAGKDHVCTSCEKRKE